jgi:hypothetical protein
MQVLQEHSPATTLMPATKGATFAAGSPPAAAGHIHVPFNCGGVA